MIMKPQQNTYTLPLTALGAKLAIELTLMFEADGRTVVDEVEEIIPGIRVRIITVLGKRPGEGQIAANVKASKR
jgi:hypothetical protein